MRYTELMERQVTGKKLLAAVRQCVAGISGDWEFPDDADLLQRITVLKNTIDQNAFHQGIYLIERAELRNLEDLPEGLVNVGCHWSYLSGAAAVYHHDNGWDDHGEDAEEITIHAEVLAADVDWPYTFATNLIHTGEYEITVRPGASILIESYWVDDVETVVNMKSHVSGDYSSI